MRTRRGATARGQDTQHGTHVPQPCSCARISYAAVLRRGCEESTRLPVHGRSHPGAERPEAKTSSRFCKRRSACSRWKTRGGRILTTFLAGPVVPSSIPRSCSASVTRRAWTVAGARVTWSLASLPEFTTKTASRQGGRVAGWPGAARLARRWPRANNDYGWPEAAAAAGLADPEPTHR